MADERTKAIDLAFAQIEKQFGKGSIMRLGSKEIVPIAAVSYTHLTLPTTERG